MNHKITIAWTGPVSLKKYGGLVYGQNSKQALAKNFNLEFIDIQSKHFKNRYLKVIESLFNLSKLKGEKDLWIRDFFSTITLFLDRTKGKNLAIIHHIGFFSFPLIARLPYLLLERIYYRNLRKMDAILTISDFWKNHFLKRGYKNVHKICCAFDLDDYNISEQEVVEFKNKHKLQGKPIIYLGNCQKPKGVVESYNALKDLDVYCITSGRQAVKLSAENLNLNHREYLTLLKACSVVVTMSKMNEGWSITTHEAMLLKTPVIGSGLGGMQELLEGGNQIVCSDFKSLREKVQALLDNSRLREKMGQDGYNFAKEFTLEKFEQEWLNLIKNILNK